MRRRGFCYVPFRVFMRYKSSTAAKAVGFSRKYSFILLLFSITYFLGITVSNSYSQFFQAIIHYDWLLVSLISAQKPFIWFSAHSSLILLKRQYSPFLSEIFADVMEWACSHTWYRLRYAALYAWLHHNLYPVYYYYFWHSDIDEKTGLAESVYTGIVQHFLALMKKLGVFCSFQMQKSV